MNDKSARDAKRAATLARLASALEGLSPEQAEQAIQIAAKLLARRARNRAASEARAGGRAADTKGALPGLEEVAPQRTQPDQPTQTLKLAPPIFDTRVVDYGVDRKLTWD